MIVTVTPNPSLDRTVTLATPLTRGAVHRVSSVTTEPGGKGVNVARALTLAGVDAVALLPASGTIPWWLPCSAAGCRSAASRSPSPVRTNIAVTEMDGTTTKINEPGARMDEATVDALTRSVVGNAEHASWVVMSGSLPPGHAGQLVRRRRRGARALRLQGRHRHLRSHRSRPWSTDSTAPHPTSSSPTPRSSPGSSASRRRRWKQRSPRVIPSPWCRPRSAAGGPRRRGSAGHPRCRGRRAGHDAGSWLATPPPIVPRSTVGAGDSSLAGYVRADVGGAEPPQRLQMAVAYGSAAAALPGSALPSPAEIDLNAVRVTSISPYARSPTPPVRNNQPKVSP